MEPLAKLIERLFNLAGYLIWPVMIVSAYFIVRKLFFKSSPSSFQTIQNTTPSPNTGTNEPEIRSSETSSNNTIDPELLKLVDNYLNLDIQNRTDRIRTKDTMAYQMADLVIRKKISRDSLTEQQNEGFVLALAATIQKSPEPDDVDRLLRAADSIQRHHVIYRVAQAFGMLLVRKKVAQSQIDPIKNRITSYMPDADAPLLHRLKHTERMLEVYTCDSE